MNPAPKCRVCGSEKGFVPDPSGYHCDYINDEGYEFCHATHTMNSEQYKKHYLNTKYFNQDRYNELLKFEEAKKRLLEKLDETTR